VRTATLQAYICNKKNNKSIQNSYFRKIHNTLLGGFGADVRVMIRQMLEKQ
jgi:hypothetical protein